MVKYDRKVVRVMERERMAIRVFAEEVDLLKKLVSDELDRWIVVIDDIVVRVYDVIPAKHTQEAIDEVKAAVLELVRSPLADLEARLACVEVELKAEAEAEAEKEPEPEVKPEPEPEVKPGKSKA
ncbi:hypothetical protein ES705_34316 [subsurface metagenome]